MQSLSDPPADRTCRSNRQTSSQQSRSQETNSFQRFIQQCPPPNESLEVMAGWLRTWFTPEDNSTHADFFVSKWNLDGFNFHTISRGQLQQQLEQMNSTMLPGGLHSYTSIEMAILLSHLVQARTECGKARALEMTDSGGITDPTALWVDGIETTSVTPIFSSGISSDIDPKIQKRKGYIRRGWNTIRGKLSVGKTENGETRDKKGTWAFMSFKGEKPTAGGAEAGEQTSGRKGRRKSIIPIFGGEDAVEGGR